MPVSIEAVGVEQEEDVLGFEDDHWHVKPENRRNRKRKQLFDDGLIGKPSKRKFRRLDFDSRLLSCLQKSLCRSPSEKSLEVPGNTKQ